MIPSAFHDWLHKLPAAHVQALRNFRRAAQAAHPDDPAYLATALEGDLPALLGPVTNPHHHVLTHHEAAAVISDMPRKHVLMIDGQSATIEGEFTEARALPAPEGSDHSDVEAR